MREFRVKRIYDDPSPDDGVRLLVGGSIGGAAPFRSSIARSIGDTAPFAAASGTQHRGHSSCGDPRSIGDTAPSGQHRGHSTFRSRRNMAQHRAQHRGHSTFRLSIGGRSIEHRGHSTFGAASGTQHLSLGQHRGHSTFRRSIARSIGTQHRGFRRRGISAHGNTARYWARHLIGRHLWDELAR